MKHSLFLAAGLFAAVTAMAAPALPAALKVPASVKEIPGADKYAVLFQIDPLKNHFVIDNSDDLSGKITRVAYFLKLVDHKGKTAWVFTAMDPFSQNILQLGQPGPSTGVIQKYVTNLEVASNVPGIKTGKFEKGNIEFWNGNYNMTSSVKIPGASNAVYDFGDTADRNIASGYGSMQVHNYMQKQTVFAWNHWVTGRNGDLGIGNCKGKHPDWTFSGSARNYKSATLYILAKIDNLKYAPQPKLNHAKVTFRGETVKAFYQPNEPIKFVLKTNFGGQKNTKPCQVKWVRTGDDKKTERGSATVVPGKDIVVTTKLAQPGFVRLQAWIYDHKGRPIINRKALFFDGGAGVQPEKLKPAAEEPKDFDAFWARQKARLAKVPMKYTMKKISKPGAKIEVFEVRIDCVGRPVTGYLTMPAGAKPKSLPAYALYHGYSGNSIQRAPGNGPAGQICFSVNAHGYDLGKPDKYYKDFYNSIKSNGQIYAFDPKQNADPEKAYFNGMTLRIMRSLEFLRALPQWNGKNLIVCGGSQGGLQTVWAAGLDPKVTLAQPSIPWCCDLAGVTKGRLGGWRPAYVPALNYYDIVFHAKRVKCPVVVTRAGLGDYVCPPSGVAILYNNFAGPKRIRWYQGSQHGYIPANPQIFEFKK